MFEDTVPAREASLPPLHSLARAQAQARNEHRVCDVRAPCVGARGIGTCELNGMGTPSRQSPKWLITTPCPRSSIGGNRVTRQSPQWLVAAQYPRSSSGRGNRATSVNEVAKHNAVPSPARSPWGQPRRHRPNSAPLGCGRGRPREHAGIQPGRTHDWGGAGRRLTPAAGCVLACAAASAATINRVASPEGVPHLGAAAAHALMPTTQHRVPQRTRPNHASSAPMGRGGA